MPQQPAPMSGPRRSRALLFGALAVALVGGGAIAGYVLLAKKDAGRGTAAATAPAADRVPDAAVAAVPAIDAAVAVAPAIDAPVAMAPIDADPVAMAPADAPRVVAAPADARKAPPPPPPPDEPGLSNHTVEIELAKLEGRISATLPTAPEFPGLMLSATQLACVLRDARKARRYFIDIGDAGMRKLAVDACRAYKIDL